MPFGKWGASAPQGPSGVTGRPLPGSSTGGTDATVVWCHSEFGAPGTPGSFVNGDFIVRVGTGDIFCAGHLNVHLLNKTVQMFGSLRKRWWIFFFFVRCNPEDSYTMWTPCFSCEGLDITAASWKPPHREGGTLNHPWEVQIKPETQQTHDTHAGSTVTLLWSASSKTGINLKPQRAEDKIAK